MVLALHGVVFSVGGAADPEVGIAPLCVLLCDSGTPRDPCPGQPLVGLHQEGAAHCAMITGTKWAAKYLGAPEAVLVRRPLLRAIVCHCGRPGVRSYLCVRRQRAVAGWQCRRGLPISAARLTSDPCSLNRSACPMRVFRRASPARCFTPARDPRCWGGSRSGAAPG